MYSAILKEGPLEYYEREWMRQPDYKVCLKYLYNSQIITSEWLNNEV